MDSMQWLGIVVAIACSITALILQYQDDRESDARLAEAARFVVSDQVRRPYVANSGWDGISVGFDRRVVVTNTSYEAFSINECRVYQHQNWDAPFDYSCIASFADPSGRSLNLPIRLDPSESVILNVKVEVALWGGSDEAYAWIEANYAQDAPDRPVIVIEEGHDGSHIESVCELDLDPIVTWILNPYASCSFEVEENLPELVVKLFTGRGNVIASQNLITRTLVIVDDG